MRISSWVILPFLLQILFGLEVLAEENNYAVEVDCAALNSKGGVQRAMGMAAGLSKNRDPLISQAKKDCREKLAGVLKTKEVVGPVYLQIRHEKKGLSVVQTAPKDPAVELAGAPLNHPDPELEYLSKAISDEAESRKRVFQSADVILQGILSCEWIPLWGDGKPPVGKVRLDGCTTQAKSGCVGSVQCKKKGNKSLKFTVACPLLQGDHCLRPLACLKYTLENREEL